MGLRGEPWCARGVRAAGHAWHAGFAAGVAAGGRGGPGAAVAEGVFLAVGDGQAPGGTGVAGGDGRKVPGQAGIGGADSGHLAWPAQIHR